MWKKNLLNGHTNNLSIVGHGHPLKPMVELACGCYVGLIKLKHYYCLD